jgi:hypothetical protein
MNHLYYSSDKITIWPLSNNLKEYFLINRNITESVLEYENFLRPDKCIDKILSEDYVAFYNFITK